MARYFLLFLLPLLVCACRPKPTEASTVVGLRADTPFEYVPYRLDSVNRPAELSFPKKRVFDQVAHQPDTNNLDLLPVRTLRLNFHLMNSTDTLYDYHGKRALEYCRKVVEQTNVMLRRRRAHYLVPDSMDVPALPSRIRIELAKKPGTDEDGVYEHYDDELYWYLHKGKNRNRSSRAVINKYAIGEDSILNIFAMGPLRDSLESPTYKIYGVSGIYLGNAIKITGWLSRNRGPWEISSVLLHEIGHALGLRHAWLRNDGCADTPPHKNNFWKLPSEETGPGKTSNNLMDYSNRQEALTPCQLGRMHARLGDRSGRQRKWLRRDWCTYDPASPITIRAETTISGARDFAGDIYVDRGASLRIDGRVHLPTGAAIFVAPGGRLELGPKAVLHNDCGGPFGGIRVGETESGVRGEVMADPAATIFNEAT